MLNYMLAGKGGACETRIHLHGGLCVASLESVSKDTATSAKTDQESIILSAATLSSLILVSLTNSPGKLRFS